MSSVCAGLMGAYARTHTGVTPHLLLRAHDNVKDSAALLGVVDLKDAPRAPERRGRVPRLKEEHRVANGIDAVAEAVDV